MEHHFRLDSRLRLAAQVNAGFRFANIRDSPVEDVVPDRGGDPLVLPDGPVGEADLPADRVFAELSAQVQERCAKNMALVLTRRLSLPAVLEGLLAGR